MTLTRTDAGGQASLAPRVRVPAIRGRTLIAASAVIAALLAAIPLAYLVVRVAEADRSAVADAMWRPRTLELLLNTSGLVLAVSATCLLIGVSGPETTSLPSVLTSPIETPSRTAQYSATASP